MSNQIPNWQSVQQARNTRMCNYLPTHNAPQFYSPVETYYFGYHYAQQYSVKMERCLYNLYFQKLENQKLRQQLFNLQRHAQKAFEKTHELAKNAKEITEVTNLKQNLFQLTSEIEQLKNELKLNSDKDVEINQLKLQISKLEADLKDRDLKVTTLNVLNKMLMDAKEERDESICQYRNELKESLSSFCDENSKLPNRSPGTDHINDNKSSSFSRKPLIEANQGLHDKNDDSEPTKVSRSYLSCTETCKECGWISRSDRELDLHMFEKHKIPSLFYVFSKSAILKSRQKS